MAASALVVGETATVARRGRRRVRPRQGPRARARATSPGWSCAASTCFLAEGVRGSLAKQAIARFGLADGREPQKYGLGMKEIWEVDPRPTGSARSRTRWAGRSARTPAAGRSCTTSRTTRSIVGFVVHLNYENPWLYPYMEFQRFKHHPLIAEVLKGGKRVAYGARAISEGGWQSIPKLTFPGGALLGGSAGFVNVPRIKGNHNAMLSGIAAAEAAHARDRAGREGDELDRLRRGGRDRADRPRPEAGAQRQADLVALRAVPPRWRSAASTCGSTRSSATARPSAR